MTTTRLLVAAILGSIAMFIWMSVAHMALPLGELGVSEIPREADAVSAMAADMGKEPALYLFPGFGLGPNPSREAKHAAMGQMADKVARNPSGLLVYYPAGTRSIHMGSLLGTEYATELVESLIVVWLLSLTRLSGFGARVGFVAALGILAAIATNISYWNWYGFPAVYTASYIFTQFVSFLAAGAVIALVLRNAPAASSSR